MSSEWKHLLRSAEGHFNHLTALIKCQWSIPRFFFLPSLPHVLPEDRARKFTFLFLLKVSLLNIFFYVYKLISFISECS